MRLTKEAFGSARAAAFLALSIGLIFPSIVYAQPKALTIVNNSVLPLTVYLDAQEGRPTRVIGFVDPVSRKTCDYALMVGRWYVTIEPYAPGTRVKPLSFTLYVKADKFAYVYEVLDRDFSPHVILPPENVSILGRWESGPWVNLIGLIVEFSARGDEYVGTIISCASELFLSRNGFYIGMELITSLKRTGINKYEGFIKERRGDGTLANAKFGVLIQGGRELYPLGWTRMETLSNPPRSNDSVPPPSLQITGITLKFFEGGAEVVESSQRRYGSSFPRYSSRFINWELNLVHPAPGSRVDFQIEAVYYNPDGSEMGRSVVNSFVGDTWLNSQHYQGRGWGEPGKWSPGRYRVDLYISGVKTAGGEFEITW